MTRRAFHQLVFTHLRQFYPEVPDWNSAVRFLRLQGESMEAFDQLGDYTDLYHAVLAEAFKRYGELSLNTYLIEQVTLAAGQDQIDIYPLTPSADRPAIHIYDPEVGYWVQGDQRIPLIKLDINNAPVGRSETPFGYFVSGSQIRIVPTPSTQVTIAFEGYGYPYFQPVDNNPENDLLMGVRSGTEDTIARYVVSRMIDPINYELAQLMRSECETRWVMDRHRNSWNRLKRATRRNPVTTGRTRRYGWGGWFE